MTFEQASRTVSPRRRPIQTRSSATVDAILEAAAILFAGHGFESVSTTLIARRAGVSVGSLYEYFPNKDALVAMLIKRHCDRMIETFASEFSAAEAGNLESVIRIFIDATYRAYAINVELHRVLLEHMGRVSKLRHLKKVSLTIVDLLQQALATCGAAVNRPGVRLAAFMVESAVEALTHRAILYAPELFNDELRDELNVMMICYLQARR